MTSSFNLVTDPWVPVILSNGSNSLVPLQDAFTRADIVDLNADPCERIAVTRLLLAISHRALQLAGEHPVERVNCERIQQSLTDYVPDYLQSWRKAFDLGDVGAGFLRLPGMTAAGKAPETSSSEKLQFQKRLKAAELTMADLALGLLTFQACYPGGLGAGNLHWGSTIISTQSARSAECPPSMEEGPIYAFIIGQTLLDTIARNVLSQSQIQIPFGVPVWEQMPQSPDDAAALRNMVSTFLGRMLPISFSIVFTPGFERMSFGRVPYSYQNEIQDPWLAYVASKKGDGSTVVRINAEKSLWRQLPAITSVPEPGKRRGNLLLQQGRNLSGAQVWAGGLAKFQANVKTLEESRFDLSSAVLERLRTEGYLRAFQGAEAMASRLRYAVKTFVNEASRLNPKGSVPYAGDAQMRYWNQLDNTKQLLFDLMDKSADPAPWAAHCFRTAHSVLSEICTPNNAREYRALVLAQLELNSQ